MTEHTIAKALEVWSLQNLVSFSVILGFLALGLVRRTPDVELRGAVPDHVKPLAME